MSDFQSNRAFTPSNIQHCRPFLRYALLPLCAMDGQEIRTIWFVIDGYPAPVDITVGIDVNITHLKRGVKEERKKLLCDVDASDLVLWKLTKPEPVEPEDTLMQRIRSRGNVATFAKRLTATQTVSTLFPKHPPKDHVHVLVQLPSTKPPPSATISPSSSDNSSLLDSLPSWLVEIHRKLWGRHDLFGQIFRTADLTEADFIELQCQLQEQNPERNTESYVAKNVLAIKSGFLRSKSTTAMTSDYGLVPQLVFDASKGAIQPPSSDFMDEDANDADDIADDIMDSDPDPGSSGCSNETTTIVPSTIRYMDLTILKLENNIRVPQLMLFRNEWGKMIDIFNERQKGIRGSAVITGQPGIGKTCLLYAILILCIVRAQPIVFQDIKGEVFFVSDTVCLQKSRPVITKDVDDILTLVDADGLFFQPDMNLFDASNLRIFLTSSPRSRKDQKWLIQMVGEMGAMLVMEPWSQEELLVASLFLASDDITLKRFQEASHICGNIPRSCFEAAVSPDMMNTAANNIVFAIRNTKELSEAVASMYNGETVHRAFQVRPSPKNRYWGSSLTEPVSDWAFSKIMDDLERRSTDAAYKFYHAIQGSPDSSVLAGKMFETKLHSFFHAIIKTRTFTIQSLDDRSNTFDIEFSSGTEHLTFGADQHFSGHLASSVGNNKSCYLKPLSPIFPNFDSFLYQHGISQPGCSPLIALQVTTAAAHPISIKGLEKVQKLLNRRVSVLNDLRPTKARKLIILFVVPDTMGASFIKQRIKDAEKVGHWYEKTTQYILALPEKEVFQSM